MSDMGTSVWARDLWLARALCGLRPYVANQGLVLPKRIAVGVGQTAVCSNGRTALGECWPADQSRDLPPHIVVSEVLNDPVRVLEVLTHELIHASDDCMDEHGEWFQTWARQLGLEGHPGTVSTPRLRRRLAVMVRSLGPYPPRTTGYVLSSEGHLVA